MERKKFTRREMLRGLGLVAMGSALAACAPKIVKETVIVEKPVEKIVKETVIVKGTPQVVEKVITAAPAPGVGVTKISWLSLDWAADQVLEMFHDDNPDIEVEQDALSWDAFFEQIQVRLAAASGEPDVFSVDVPMVAPYSYKGWLLPLEEVFSQSEKDDWLESSLKAGTYEGKLMAPPVSTSTQLLMYNKDLFDRAGIEPPGENERWTWEKVAQVAQQVTFDDDGDGIPEIWGFIWEQFIRIYQLQAMPMSLGGKAIGDDGLTVRGVIDTDPWIEAFTYYRKAFNEWKFAPQGDIGWPTDTLFRTGKLAFVVAGPWNINQNIDANLEFEWGVSRHPYFESGDIVTPTGSWHIGVNATTNERDAALRWVRWLSTSPGAEYWWRYGSHDFPAQKSVLNLFQTDPEFNTPPMSYQRVAADEAGVNPQPRPVTPGYLEYEEILGDTFEDMRNGADVRESLAMAVDRIETQMEKY